MDAVSLIQSILPGIRQARYLNAVLRGGPGEVDHIMVHHLPYIIPVKAYFVRIYKNDIKNESKSWSDFFKRTSGALEEEIWLHSSKIGTDNYYESIKKEERFFIEPFNCLTIDKIQNPVNQKYKEIVKNDLETNHKNTKSDGFISILKNDQKNHILFCFSATGKTDDVQKVKVVALVDEKFMLADVLEKQKQYFNYHVSTHKYLKDTLEKKEKSFHSLFKLFAPHDIAARLNGTIATMLKPEEGIVTQISTSAKASETETYAKR